MTYFTIGVIVLIVGSSIFLAVMAIKKRGGFRSKSRQLDLALVGLTQRIRKNPNDAKAHVRRAIVRYRKKDVKGALTDLGRALELDDCDVEAHYHCGIVCHETGDLKRAKQEFTWIRENSEDPFYKIAVRERLQKIEAAGWR